MFDLSATPNHIVEVFDRLKSAWRAHGGLSLDERRDILKRLRASLIDRSDAYVAAISADFRGRSRHETLIAEIAVVVSAIDYTLPRIAKWARPTRIPLGLPIWPASAKTVPQPRGVVGVVAPSNYPLQLALMPMISAVSAGCRVLIKPSEMTPRTSELIAEHIAQTFDPGIAGVVCGDASVSAQFVRLPLDALLFTGSHRVGAMVAAAAAENMTPLILELGGKSPVVIDNDADLARASESIVAGKLMNAGQTCVAPDYVLVPRSKHEAFVTALKAAASKLYPEPASLDYSAMISDAAIARLEKIAASAPNEALLSGSLAAPRVTPKLMTDVARDSLVMREEIFGPLLPIVPYDTIDEAIDLIRDYAPPLVIYWFGEANDRFEALTARTMSGAISINDTLLHAGIAALPFGGVGASGVGRYHGKAGFDAFSNERVIFSQSKYSLTRLLRPPYGKRTDRILARLLGWR